MAATSQARGHAIRFDGAVWRYVDNGEPVGEGLRRCALCQLPPTEEGHDACLGKLEGVIEACCGHGVKAGYTISADGAWRELPTKRLADA